jgi:hypothetical protein
MYVGLLVLGPLDLASHSIFLRVLAVLAAEFIHLIHRYADLYSDGVVAGCGSERSYFVSPLLLAHVALRPEAKGT